MSRTPGSITRRGERRWLVRLFEGVDGASGKRRYRSETVHGTKKQAERVLQRMIEERSLGLRSGRQSLGEYLDEWLDRKRSAVEPRTLEGYEALIDAHIRPALGARAIEGVRPADVQALYASVLASHGAHAQAATHRVLHAALGDAVKGEQIIRNPATGRTLARVPRRKFVALNAEQTRKLITELDKHRLGIVFVFTLSTGMRPGEVQALRWDCVDLDVGAVTVERAVKELKGGRFEFGAPKTHRTRRIPIDPALVSRLRAHRASQAQQRLKVGLAYEDQRLVFATRTGGILARQNLSSRVLKPALERAKLPAEFRWYDCRHTCATLILSAGISAKVAAERLGHASAAFTLDRYAHVAPGIQEQATERLGEMLFHG